MIHGSFDEISILERAQVQCSTLSLSESECFMSCPPIKSRKRMIKPHKVTSLVLMTSSDKILFDVPKCVSKTCDVIYFEVIGSVLDCSDEFNFKSECDLQCNEGYTKTNLYVQLKMI